PGALPLRGLHLLPRRDWAGGLAESWRPGEAGAQELLDIFGDSAVHAHLAQVAADAPATRRPDLEPWLRQLGWREFAHHVLHHFPETPTESLNSAFREFRWSPPDPGVLDAWQRGRTGIPLVD